MPTPRCCTQKRDGLGSPSSSQVSWKASFTTSHCQILPLKWLTSSVMCFFRIARSSVLSIVPFATPVVSHDGSWLCQTRVWPRTSWWFAFAKATRRSAGAQLYWPRGGSTVSHFISFSGGTVENWSAMSALYFGLASSGGLTAVPMRRPTRAPRSRSESLCVPTAFDEGAASAAVGARRSEHAPTTLAAPRSRVRRKVTDGLLCQADGVETFRCFERHLLLHAQTIQIASRRRSGLGPSQGIRRWRRRTAARGQWPHVETERSPYRRHPRRAPGRRAARRREPIDHAPQRAIRAVHRERM